MAMQSLTQQPKRCRPSTTWAGNCSLISLTAQTLPFILCSHESDDEFKSIVSDWLRHRSIDSYAEGIRKFLHRWEKCVKLKGNYEKKKASI